MISVSSLMWTDEDLLRELGGALREAPADGRIIAAAEAAFSWRTADEELELLLLEAETSLGTLAGAVRGAGPAAPRTLTFCGEQLSVEMPRRSRLWCEVMTRMSCALP